jgi:alpha-D-xyloside xylohydrolase
LYTAAGADGKEKARKLYLPKATWYDFWTGQTLAGGKTIIALAPIDILPLYIKAGSIIPMGPVVEYATEKTNQPIELRIYPGANGEFKFYEDENDNYNYEKGQYATFTFNWNDKLHQLGISAIKGDYPNMQQQRTFNVVLVKGEHGSNVGITINADKTIKYDGKAMMVQL